MKNADERTIDKYLGLRSAYNDRTIEQEFRHLVMYASEGDPRAIGAIAAAFGSDLLGTAKDTLGKLHGEAGTVIEEFLSVLVNRRSPYVAYRDGCPERWMHWVVRSIAQHRRRERLRCPKSRDDPEINDT